MTSKQQKAFTLVELIVVITILAILATIGFISLLGYQISARDSTRISDVKLLEKKLRLYQVETPQFPLPDSLVTLTTSGSTVGYQGEVGTGVLVDIRQAGDIVDPLTKERYTYSLNVNQNAFQILALMENSGLASQKTPSLLTSSYASNADKYPRIFTDAFDGRGVIILNDENVPLQDFETGSFELKMNTHTLKLIFSDGESLTASGYAAGALANTRLGISNPSLSCPEGFISVPGNPEFNTEDFCVAQYEMTYSDADTPNTSVGGAAWNSAVYIPGKQIVSQAGRYPIGDISQTQAIAACQSMGIGYHLITNNEWMTIARSIEANPQNWSSGFIGEGIIFNGVSGDEDMGCGNTGGNIEARSFSTRTGKGLDSLCNDRRKHILLNDNEIWDISGNLWEHVNKGNTVDGSGYNVGHTSVSSLNNTTGIYSIEDMKKYGSMFGFGLSHGMGTVVYPSGRDGNVFYRGGRAPNGNLNGIYMIEMQRNEVPRYGHLGFRCAYIK